MTNKILIALLAFLCIANIAQAAGNNIALSVSITIPAIPGVNVPLDDKEAQKDSKAAAPETESLTAQEETKTENTEQPIAIAQKQKEYVIVSLNKDSSVQTIYTR